MTLILDVEAGRATDSETGSRYYEHPVTGELLWSVTTILSGTQGKPWLTQWSAKLAAEYAVDHLPELGALASAEGREAAVRLAREQARLLRERKADAGTYVHDVVEALGYWAASGDLGAAIALPELPAHLIGADYDGKPLEKVVAQMVDGFMNWAADFGARITACEMAVYNRVLGYGGTLDEIAELDGYGIGPTGRLIAAPGRTLRVCVDVKTGKNLDVTHPEQLSAYGRALECRLPLGQVAPMPPTDCAAVLHLRPEHERGYQFMIIAAGAEAQAWNRFRRAAELHTARDGLRAKPGRVSRALLPDGTMPPVLLADLGDEGYDRAPGALFKAGVRDLDQLAAMDAGDCLACKGVGPKSLPHIRRMLADHGLSLRGEENLALIPAGDPGAKVA